MTCFSLFLSPRTPPVTPEAWCFPVFMVTTRYDIFSHTPHEWMPIGPIGQQKNIPANHGIIFLPLGHVTNYFWIWPFPTEGTIFQHLQQTSIGNPNSMIPGASIHLGHHKVWKFGCLKHVVVMPSSHHPMPLSVVKSSSAPIFSEMYFWAFEKES